MGCCISSPHKHHQYNDGDNPPIRQFGIYRNNSNVVPDDIQGMSSTHILGRLACQDTLLYDADIDQGQPFRCCRPLICILLPFHILICVLNGIRNLSFTRMAEHCTCDQWCCWVRKEYSTRTFFRIYPNRIEFNELKVRLWGMCGCGSWTSDNIKTHPFDRGAFGFRRVSAGVKNYLCCLWPLFGGVVARQRCQCNGPLWNRMFTDCGGWWCDEWPCGMMCCAYRYYGLGDADEVAFAASIALQAYFEGRPLDKDDMEKCIEYWKQNISEKGDPEGRRRDICCEPFCIPLVPCICCYYCAHRKRDVPDLYYMNGPVSEELNHVYNEYEQLRQKQIDDYKKFDGPVRTSTVCRRCGCRRAFGRKGFIFCTEGCNHCSRKAGEPAPPFDFQDIDDDNDAARVLLEVLGPPPKNVLYTRQEYDEEKAAFVINQYPTHRDHDDDLPEPKRVTEVERLQKEAEEARIAAEVEAKRVVEVERLKKEAEETGIAAEEEAERIAEEELLQKEVEEARIAAEVEAKRIAEVERLRKKAEEVRIADEVEAQNIAEEERL